jgi:hypothetical protein
LSDFKKENAETYLFYLSFHFISFLLLSLLFSSFFLLLFLLLFIPPSSPRFPFFLLLPSEREGSESQSMISLNKNS